jgi:carbonic anhydrase
LHARLRETVGQETDREFLPFSDLDKSVRDDVAALRTERLLLQGVPVTGFVYDVRSGRLRQVA